MPSTLPLRIAVLECDTPMPAVRERYNGYGEAFGALLRAGADALQYPGLSRAEGLELSSWDVVEKQEYPELANVDGILISGSKYNSYDDTPWILKLVDFVKGVLAQGRVRLIGVCFGHQIIARALGVKVGRCAKGWEASVTQIELTPKGKEIFGQPSLAIHQMHTDMVYAYPEGVEPLAYNHMCEVHGMYAAKRLITIQGHPEFNGFIVRIILTARHDMGIFDAKFYEDCISRVDLHHDSVAVSKAFLRFLLE